MNGNEFMVPAGTTGAVPVGSLLPLEGSEVEAFLYGYHKDQVGWWASEGVLEVVTSTDACEGLPDRGSLSSCIRAGALTTCSGDRAGPRRMKVHQAVTVSYAACVRM